MGKFLLDEMSWEECRELLPKVQVAIVPVGSTEQHGPHLPLMVDHACAVAMARRVGEKMYPRAVVTPSIPVGVSYHHMIYPGSLTVSENTLVSYAYDIAASLKHHGMKLIFFLNGHWGNKTALAHATRKIRSELGVKVLALSYWDLFPMEHAGIIEDGEIPDHAGEFESALMMHIRGDLVKSDYKRPADAYTLDKRKTELLLIADDQFPIFSCSKDGIIYGSPAKATAGKGRKIVELVSDEIVKFLDDLIATY